MLPKQFIPTHNYDLIRIGSKRDGGYLVEKQSVKNSKMLVGLGLDDNWTFEKEFTKNYQLPLAGFDRGLDFKYLIWKFIIKIIKLLWRFTEVEEYKDVFNHFLTIIDYFRCRKYFYRKFIGYTDSEKGVTFPTLVKRFVDKTPFFVKCDIESWEYRILDDLVLHAPNISGTVIEFHDVDLHRDRIIAFIEKFPLTLVHIHPNNNAGVDRNQDPVVIELTFARDPVPINDLPCALPHPLDEPCSLRYPDIFIVNESSVDART